MNAELLSSNEIGQKMMSKKMEKKQPIKLQLDRNELCCPRMNLARQPVSWHTLQDNNFLSDLAR